MDTSDSLNNGEIFMKPQDALEFVDRICSQVSLNREGHIQLQIAIRVLKEKINGKKPEPQKKTK